MQRGYVRLWRKTKENPIVMKDAAHLSVWIYLLLNATHKDYQALFAGRSIVLKPGQLITGRRSIAKSLKISESRTQRILKLLEIEQLIEQQTNNRQRLITIVSWGLYQQSEQQSEQQPNNKRTTSEQQANTNNNNKNIKNTKNIKNNKEKKSPVEIPPELSTSDFKKSWEAWKKFRKEIKKKLAPSTEEKQLKKLAKWGEKKAILAIENSIFNQWQGLFEPNKQTKSQNSQGSWLEDLQNIDLEA